ncbi:hypothetical protein, partial [Staphylococcus nepalensis]|uniref:hypothetical protein n=1 Tax=Staphylococcus nepalensis TaxID=214473 RepID=UPI00285DE2EF
DQGSFGYATLGSELFRIRAHSLGVSHHGVTAVLVVSHSGTAFLKVNDLYFDGVGVRFER